MKHRFLPIAALFFTFSATVMPLHAADGKNNEKPEDFAPKQSSSQKELSKIAPSSKKIGDGFPEDLGPLKATGNIGTGIPLMDLSGFKMPPFPNGVQPKSGSKEEKEYYKKVYEQLLPAMENISAQLKVLQAKPDMQPVFSVLGQKKLWGEYRIKTDMQKRDLVLEPLLSKYVRDNKIKPTEAQIKEGTKEFDISALDKLPEELQAESNKLLKKMQNPKLTKEELSALSEQYDKMQEAQSNITKLRNIRDSKMAQVMVGQYLASERKLTRKMAKDSLIKKYNATKLYNTENGEEPLEAYRDFLKDAEKSGDFVFINKKEADGFWQIFEKQMASDTLAKTK